MSMTKRYIEDLYEQAQSGDVDAQETLSEAGLWVSDEDWRREEEEKFYTVDESEIDEDYDPFEFGF